MGNTTLKKITVDSLIGTILQVKEDLTRALRIKNFESVQDLELFTQLRFTSKGELIFENEWEGEIRVDSLDDFKYTAVRDFENSFDLNGHYPYAFNISIQVMGEDYYDPGFETVIDEIRLDNNPYGEQEYSRLVLSADSKRKNQFDIYDTIELYVKKNSVNISISDNLAEKIAKNKEVRTFYNEIQDSFGGKFVTAKDEIRNPSKNDLQDVYIAMVKDREDKITKIDSYKVDFILDSVKTNLVATEGQGTILTEVKGVNIGSPSQPGSLHENLIFPSSYLNIDTKESNRVERFEDDIRRKGKRWEIGGGYFRHMSNTKDQRDNINIFLKEFFGEAIFKSSGHLDINLDLLFNKDITKIKTVQIGKHFSRITTESGEKIMSAYMGETYGSFTVQDAINSLERITNKTYQVVEKHETNLK